MNTLRLILLAAAVALCPIYAGGAPTKKRVEGFVHSAKTLEPVVGAAVLVKGTGRSAMTGADGRFLLENLERDACTLQIRCMSYKPLEAECRLTDEVTRLSIGMEEEALTLDEVVVKGAVRRSAEVGMVQSIRSMPQVASGMSGAQIAKGPDRVAAEVMRRISGVSIIDDRLIIVRGLSQRYNNAWINGLSAPSTETDSRAFPFDLVPSSQIDNLVVYKSPSPEIPADFSGGFVKITSKSVPDENLVEVSYQTGFNVSTAGRSFRINSGSATDVLGFDSKRALPDNFPQHFPKPDGDPDGVTRLSREGFNNDWRIKTITPLPDQRLSLTAAQRIALKDGRQAGVITAVSYSNTFSSIGGMTNARYGIYNAAADKPTPLDSYRDNRYSNDARLGALSCWSLALNPSHRLEFKNLLNILGRNRLTERTGVKDMSSPYYREQTEMQYTSRLTYNGQLAGTHDLTPAQALSWDAGYAYARKDEPDRRIVTNQAGMGSVSDAPPAVVGNDNVSRYFQNLHDNTVSAALSYKYDFGGEAAAGDSAGGLGILPVIKAGAYGEYHTRSYTPREFTYRYEKLDHAFRSNAYLLLPVEEMLSPEYLSADKVYVEELSIKTSAYAATVRHAAAYAAVDVPLGRFSIYAGVRVEHHATELSRDRSLAPAVTLLSARTTTDFDLLPSVNLTYRLSEAQQLRAAYGRSLNRPEVREMSPAVYFDFDLFSEIGGNENLKTASIHNFDLRYELYPNRGETVSFGVFYKRFANPIEWTFIDMGGTLRYCYENAKSARNFGVEVDVQKTLDFAGMPNFSLALNAALIESRVQLMAGEVVSEPDRPMQGQSPYVVNAGLYYRSPKYGLSASLLYNRIGKRIVGLGKFNSADNNDVNSHIPNTYEMPRNALDFSLSKAIGQALELRCSIKDIFSENVVYKQFPVFRRDDGAEHQREQITRRYNPGQHFSVGIRWKIR
ncbi:MAG: TonB-dependent receptor [Prevotellaceae bacterium]|jgi:outer membrane receptor protein involved in Fe transport|nr:TonB-dependent receptor [Prevotellaceae bacterium]